MIDANMAQIVEILPYGRQGTVYPTESIPWLGIQAGFVQTQLDLESLHQDRIAR